MTPNERSSLRAALVISLSIYTAIFLVFAFVPAGGIAVHPRRAGNHELPLLVKLIGGGRGSNDPRSEAAGANLLSVTNTIESARERLTAAGSGVQSSSARPRPTTILPTARKAETRHSAARAPQPDHSTSAPSAGPVKVETAPSIATDGSALKPPNYSEWGLQQQGKGSSVAGPGAGGGSRSIGAILASIRERLVRDRIYPTAAERRGIQGRVTVAATVGADGTLLRSHIVQSSGSKILDTAGITLLRRVFPIENTVGHGFTVEIPITYRLQNTG